MSARDDGIDANKRKFLKQATATVAAVGVSLSAVPFVSSLLPNAQAEAAGAPVKVDLSQLKPGEQLTVNWRGRPVWIIHRSPEMLTALKQEALSDLRDPDSEVAQQPLYAKNAYRSRRPEYLVVVGLCTHLGCAPTYRPEPGAVEQQWPGGFLCSCHGSKFDLAGRVFKGVPAPINLEVPPHQFLDEHTLLVGVDHETVAQVETV